jgi:hypothetical protein
MTAALRATPMLGTFGFILIAVASSGCATSTSTPRFSGWLTNGSAAILASRPQILRQLGTATLDRDPSSNALTLSLGPPVANGARASTIAGAVRILLRFQTPRVVSDVIKNVYLPLLASRHVSLDRVWVTDGGGEIGVALSCDQLGLDLVATTLFSPAGLQGVADFGAAGAVALEARAVRPEFLYGSLWTIEERGRTSILVRSHVEYPVWLYDVETVERESITRISINRMLPPHKWIRLSVGRRANAHATALRAAPIPVVPTAFWQRYRLSKGETR